MGDSKRKNIITLEINNEPTKSDSKRIRSRMIHFLLASVYGQTPKEIKAAGEANKGQGQKEKPTIAGP